MIEGKDVYEVRCCTHVIHWQYNVTTCHMSQTPICVMSLVTSQMIREPEWSRARLH